MRFIRIVALGAAVSGCVFVGVIAADIWQVAHTIYPASENQSIFLRGYDLKAAVQPFRQPNESYGESRTAGGAAHANSATLTASFSECFVMQSDLEEDLLLAVREDVFQRFSRSGAQIVSQSGSASTGLRFDYRTSNTIGALWIRPVTHANAQRKTPLSHGLEDVDVEVEINEEWFPNGVAAQAATAALN